MMHFARRWSAGVAFALGVFSCFPAITQASEDDPWESFNRPVFIFNDTLDTWVLKPIAIGYKAVSPQFVEDGVSNVFNNVGDVGNLANNLLQGKLHNAGVDTARLLINTTAGVFGLFDVATHLDLPRNNEDFGQTLGAWGVTSGPYLVLPFLGPSTPRDAFGRVADSFLKAYPYMEHVPTRNTTFGLDITQQRAGLLGAEKAITGDKYIFIRNAYLQNREFHVQDGQVKDDF